MEVLDKMKKLKIGLVGLGMLGIQHAEDIAFRIPNAELYALCTRTEEKLNAVQNKLSVPHIYTDYNKMICNSSLDAIVISSSSSVHKEQIEKALNVGLHVFCEKPLTTSIQDAKYIEKVIESHSQSIFMLGFMRRYDKSYLHAKKLIQSGKIGKPVIIKSYSADPAWQSETFSSNTGTSGGLFMDLGIHDIDLARWYFQDEAVSVYALGNCYNFTEFAKSGDVDNGMSLIEFKNGQTFLMHAGRTCMHGYHTEMEIIGTEGSLRIGVIPEKNLSVLYSSQGVIKECCEDYIERFEGAYHNELLEFVDCVSKNRRPEVAVEDGVQAIRIADACKLSLETREKVIL